MADLGSKPNDPGRWRNYSRTGALWAIIMLMVLFVLNWMRAQEEPSTDLTYTEFREQLENDNIERVTVIDLRRVTGQLRSPVPRNNRQVVAFETTLPGELSPDLEDQMLAQGVVMEGKRDEAGWGTILLSALPWLLFIAFWIWIFRTMQSGGNRAFQFGRSKAKLISPDTPKVTFADVAGADEAKEELQEIIEFLKDPQRFARLGGRLPKGVLLVGSPGTGKTLLARAVAGEAGRPFFQMSGSDFVEMFVGVGASRVRDLFEQGKDARAVHHLRRRDRRGGAPSRCRSRRRARRARADSERALGGDGRLRTQRGSDSDRGHEPS